MAEETTNNENQTQQTENEAVERTVEKDGVKLTVSDNFWDKEKNAPDVWAILKSQQDLRSQIGEDKSPKDGLYEIHIPDAYKDKLAEDQNDPLWKEFCKMAKSKRMSQEEVDAVTSLYYKALADNTETFDSEEYFTNEVNLMKQKFGPDLDKVSRRINNFVANSGITDKDMLNELKFMQTTASGVALLDYLLSLRGDEMPSNSNAATAGFGKLSLAELRNLQSKPGYMDGTDKALIDKVTKGYEALYGSYNNF